MQDYVERLPAARLRDWVRALQILLATPPVIERRSREISERYVWLASIGARCVARLLESRDPAVLAPPALWVLRNVREVDDLHAAALQSARKTIGELVPAWSELNRTLFWYDVAETRAAREKKPGTELSLWEVGMFGRDWAFGPDAFPIACNEIRSRPLPDDRRLALVLAFELYRLAERPVAWRRQLHRAVADDAALQAVLHDLLHPRAHPDAGKWRRQQAQWKAQSEARAAKAQANRERAVEFLKRRVDGIRDYGKANAISQDQWYLHDRLREQRDPLNRWSVSDWRALEPEFGHEVAKAFRDGAVGFWRRFSPPLRSQGGKNEGTPVTVIFGLSGLNIEAAETSNWTNHLTPAEARIATRYGLSELNGFSVWLPDLHSAFPTEVEAVVLAEIDYELAISPPDGGSHRVLYNVAWHGSWMFDGLAPAILARLKTVRPSPTNLGYLLSIINRSSLAGAAVRPIAARKAKTIKGELISAIWFAQWCGDDPDVAIPALKSRLAELKKAKLRTSFAMLFLTNLVGGRRIGMGFAPRGYREVRYMKELLLLMHLYIRQADDIDRVGKGVYSPGMRDDAQGARSALLSFITETPGKEAFLALMEIAADHPDAESRPWAAFRAKTKAAQDADLAPWSTEQIREFAAVLERTPQNHHELWDLAVDRLTDLKGDLEGGDASPAKLVALAPLETDVRNFIGGWCRDRAAGRYVIPQEEEMADAKRPDLRFHGVGFDGPVPAELKLADAWTGPKLFERLENQLCGDYLRDARSSRGIYVLVYRGEKASWEHPAGGRLESFDALVAALREQWVVLSTKLANVEDIAIIAMDLTKRAIPAGATSAGAKPITTRPS